MESNVARSEPPPTPGASAPAPLYATAADPPRPLRTLGRAAMIALGLVMVANLMALWVDLIQLDIATDLQNGERVPFEELNASDDRVATTGLLQGACYLTCFVAFLVWYGRAYRNLERLGAQGLRWGHGWAIAYWFIPIANLFRPKQVVNDIWRASDPDLPVRGRWTDRHVSSLIHWWWAFWLLSGFAERILFRRSLDDVQTPADFVSLSQTYIAWDLVDVIPTVLAILVVRSITARQEERRRRFEGGELAKSEPAPSERELDEPVSFPTDVPVPKTLAERRDGGA